MDYIRKKEWLFFVPFFILSVLYGKLILLRSKNQTDLLDHLVIGLEWLFSILLIVSLLYGIYKLIKKNYTLEKVWLFSGIFILLLFAGGYQFELLLNDYDLALNNVIFHDIMFSPIFTIPYAVFLLYYVIKSRKDKSRNGLNKVDILILFMLLLLPFLRSINSYILRDIFIEGLKNKRITLITRAFFSEDMSYYEMGKAAEKITDQISLSNTYIKFLNPKVIYGAIIIGGIALIREKITYQKYLALGGTFLFVQYLGITCFDKILTGFNPSFESANNSFLYQIVLKYSYSQIYIIPLALYSLKKIYFYFVRNKGIDRSET